MSAETTAETVAETVDLKTPAAAAEEIRAKAETWLKDSGEKARDAALKATEDLKAAGDVAIEGELAHNAKFLEMMKSLVDARAAAAVEVLKAGDLSEAVGIEQAFAREAMETVSARTIELIRMREVFQ